MSFSQIVKGTILPKVPLKTLFEEDTSVDGEGTPAYRAPKYTPDSAQKTGANKPFIKISDQIVKDIESLTIDETGFIPTVSLTFIDRLGEFAPDYFPKQNLIMNVYLKSGSEKFKPVRCDFLIKSIKSIAPKFTGEKRGVGEGATYMVKGELYIPNIYNNLSKSYSGLNSKDALKRICDELGLGFAENESAPNDKMTWINTNMSSLDFIKKILDHTYQDDDSFFMGFIDKYYYLNYIEVNRQLRIEEADKTFVAALNPLQGGVTQDAKDSAKVKENEELTTINYLTTEMQYKAMSNYVTELSLISEQGDIIKRQGYRRNIYYYDHFRKVNSPNEKFQNFFVEPLRSDDRKADNYLIPIDQDLATNQIKKWMNIDYGNAHQTWNEARLINSHNLKELEKIKIKATLNGINFQVLRGFSIPMYVSIQQAEKIRKAAKPIADTETKTADDRALNKQVPDEQLTGYYYVSGAKYHYDSLHPFGFHTELFLARREWKPSKITG